jgi:hypothetical protein
LIADIAVPAWRVAALPPNIAGASLLPDPGLVLAPDLEPLGLGMGRSNLVQARSKASFLKACWAFWSLCGWRGRVLRWLMKAIVLAGPDPAADKIGRWRVVDLCRYVEERWES